ncbi:MAG: hypothetical protein P8Q41_00525 [Saprospiraceae bacterium]|jgi:hypothetical protein|nr:hypothetical protein [Saprospiraceae bacterium]
MENRKFDDFIKQSLEHLDGGKYIPMDWSSMNEQMNTDSLDDAMKGSLENLEGAAFVPMDWNMMESKLDAAMSDAEIDPQMEDIYLDAIAYDHLKNMQPAYNHEHWEMMSARLDEEYAYRRKVFVTKLFEVAIVLLLVWTAFNYFPNKKTPTPSSPFPIAVGTDTNSNQYNTNYLSTDLNEQSLLDNKSVVSFETTIPASIQDEGIKRIINEFPALVVETNPINQNAFTSIPTPPTSDNKITETPFSNNANSINLLNNKTQKATFLPLEKTLTLDEDEMLKEKLIVQISPIPSIMNSILVMDELSKGPFSLDQIIKKKKLRTHEVFFSMYSSADLNFVDSDFYNNNKREWDVYQRYRYGYGGGFALGFQLKRFLVETGISYNFVSYKQREEANIIGSFTSGYLEEQWDDAELNMVQIPLNIQYSFLVKRKWRMYSLTGVSINMALQNNYNFQLEDQENSSSRSISLNESEIANEASLYKGILEGGGLRENSYITANLGFGVERKFTYRWSLFLQPIYRRHFLIDGIGPNEDRIHSSSLRFGAKVKIR